MAEESRAPYTNYVSVMETLKRRVDSGEYSLGCPLPSERALAEELSVNRRTLRRALEVLHQQGVLEPRGGRGGHVPVGMPRPAPIGFCLDLSLPETTEISQSSLVAMMLAQGVARRLVTGESKRTLVWCKQNPGGELDAGVVSSVAGMIIWPTLPASHGLTARLRTLRHQVPVVLLDRRLPGFESDFVGFDDRGIGRSLAEHLIGLGHQTFAFFGWGVPETVHERLGGAMEAVREAGGQFRWEDVYLAAEDGTAASRFDDFLARKAKPTALICANDHIAIALIFRLRDEGYAIPGDFAVVGVGNSLDRTLDAIGLTTVAQDSEELGWEAADLLLSRLEGDPQRSPVIERRLAARLVIRRSCGSTSSRIPTAIGDNEHEKK